MILIGCKPDGRHTEQHDIFFGIASSVKELVPDIISFWPEAKGKMHLDGWREVTTVDGYHVSVQERGTTGDEKEKLFFINLGGYKQNEFEEFHYKLLTIADDKGKAIQQAKQTAFYKHTGFEGANSHVDDKYGVDVDDIYDIEDVLPENHKEKYQLVLTPAQESKEDELHLGYFVLHKL